MADSDAHGFYRWKCYVFGVDVTDDLMSISIPRSDARQAGNATFTLANPFDRYTIAPEDLELLYQGVTAADDGELSEAKDQVESHFFDKTKQLFIRTKLGEKQTVTITGAGTGPPTQDGGSVAGPAHSVEILRWRFASGLPIIHPGDPVTFFEMDPTTLRWYWGFSGKVRVATPENDPSGRAVVTLTCVDALGPLEHARTSFNPSIIDASVISSARDLVSRQWFADGIPGVSLPEYVSKLVFGHVEGDDNTSKLLAAQLEGAGVKSASLVRYGPHADEPTVEPLALTAAGAYDVKRQFVHYLGKPGPTTKKPTPTTATAPISTARQLLNARAGQTEAEFVESLNPRGTDANISEQTSGLSPLLRGQADAQRAFKAELNLEPPPAQPSPVTVLNAPVPDVSITTLELWQDELDWEVTHEDMLRLADFAGELPKAQADIDQAQSQFDLVELIGKNPQRYPVDRGRVMQLYPTVLKDGGDKNILLKDIIQGPGFVTEFKSRLAVIYDILQRIDHVMYATPKGDVVIELPLTHFDADRWGYYADAYTFTRNDNAGRTMGLDVSHMVSVMTSDWSILAGYSSESQYTEVTGRALEVAVSHALVAQFGVRIEKAPVRVFLASPEAARAYAQSQLTRLNGELDTCDLNLFPRLGLGPNRPMYDAEKFIVGTIRNINWSVQWGSSATMKLSLNHMRRWQGGRRKDGLKLLEPVDGLGVENDGYNWASIFADPSSGGTDRDQPQAKKTQDSPDSARKVAGTDGVTLSGPVSAAVGIQAIKDAIIQGESGGRNIAGARPNANGTHDYGIGQVNSRNIGPWTLEALGRRYTIAEWNADIDAQHAVIDFKMREYYMRGLERYGGDAVAAARYTAVAWNAGPGGADGNAYETSRPQRSLDSNGNVLIVGNVRNYADKAVARFIGNVERARTGYASGSTVGP